MIMETANQQPAVNVYPNGNAGGGLGDIFGTGSGGIILWLILFFFMMMFMGWGNNGNASAAQYVPYMAYSNAGDAVRQGFDQAAIINSVGNLQAVTQQGFNSAEVSRCNQQANLLATMNNNHNATITALQNQAMALQNCCCENRANIADVKYALATEGCADRAAVKDALQEVSAQNAANTQRILDMMCQDKIDAKNEKIAELQNQLTLANLAASQGAQTAAILANNDAQTAALEQYLAPVPRPAYVVQNPNCCGNMSNYYTNTCRCCGQ